VSPGARLRQAAELARIALLANPSLPLPALTLAAALHRDGRVEEARKVADE